MATKKNLITEDLDWAEQQLNTWKEYIDANPFATMTDRVQMKVTKTGGAMPMVIANIETQITSVRNTMKDYLALLEVVKRLRVDDEKKQEAAKGSAEIPLRMRNQIG
jgi:hypothetical protein